MPAEFNAQSNTVLGLKSMHQDCSEHKEESSIMTGSNREVPLCRAKNIMNKKHYNYLLDVIIINPKQNDAHQILYWKHNDLGVKMCLNRRKV